MSSSEGTSSFTRATQNLSLGRIVKVSFCDNENLLFISFSFMRYYNCIQKHPYQYYDSIFHHSRITVDVVCAILPLAERTHEFVISDIGITPRALGA